MKQKHVDASREVRLWITQVIAPIVGVVLFIPDSRNWVKQKVEDFVAWVKSLREK